MFSYVGADAFALNPGVGISKTIVWILIPIVATSHSALGEKRHEVHTERADPKDMEREERVRQYAFSPFFNSILGENERNQTHLPFFSLFMP